MATSIVGPFVIEGMDYMTMFGICILLWLVTSVGMTLPFQINYLFANWQTRLVVDDNLKTIKLIQSEQTYDYKIPDNQVTRHILGHYYQVIGKA